MSMMCNRKIEELQAGDMIIYPFLWAWEVAQGVTHAAKERPCIVALRRDRAQAAPILVILPITTRAQEARNGYIPLPQSELRRAGLNGLRPQGVMVRDCNLEDLSNPIGLRPLMHARRFSASYTQEIAQCFTQEVEREAVRPVARYAVPCPESDPVPEP